MDKTTFIMCVNNYRDLVYGHAWYFFGNPDDAADTTQEVFMKLWQHRDTIDSGNVKNWLMKVARNQCIDHFRKKRELLFADSASDSDNAEGGYEIAVEHENPEKKMMAEDTKQQLLDGIRNLPPALRSVLIMREVQNNSYNDIARALNISLASVKVQLHRARRILFGYMMAMSTASDSAASNHASGLLSGEKA